MQEKRIYIEGISIDDFKELIAHEVVRIIDAKYGIKNQKELLSIKECADKRGVSSQTIRNWMRTHELKRFRMGRRIFLDYNEIMQKLERV